MTIDGAITVLIAMAVTGLVCFVLVYAIRSPWYTTRTGRAVMGFKAIMVVAGLASLGEQFFDEEGFDLSWFIILIGVNIAVAYLVWALIRAQRRERHDSHVKEE